MEKYINYLIIFIFTKSISVTYCMSIAKNSNLLGMYVYVKDKLNIKPFIIIGKNL
jgi:hypothetical protein